MKFLSRRKQKGLIKKVDIKQCIKSYRFADESLFIVLKTGQNLEGGIPSLRADTLMELIHRMLNSTSHEQGSLTKKS